MRLSNYLATRVIASSSRAYPDFKKSSTFLLPHQIISLGYVTSSYVSRYLLLRLVGSLIQLKTPRTCFHVFTTLNLTTPAKIFLHLLIHPSSCNDTLHTLPLSCVKASQTSSIVICAVNKQVPLLSSHQSNRGKEEQIPKSSGFDLQIVLDMDEIPSWSERNSAFSPPNRLDLHSNDTALKWLHSTLPLSVQHQLRDEGILRFFADLGVLAIAPLVLSLYPSVIPRAVKLYYRRRTFAYGQHAHQTIDYYTGDHGIPCYNPNAPAVAFVHGGAWGSGRPWMYQLMVDTLLALGFSGVFMSKPACTTVI